MVETRYGQIKGKDYQEYLLLLKNKVYKLLPLREEKLEWEKYLKTIQIEINGLTSLTIYENSKLIMLSSKIEGLLNTKEFFDYRKTIFECLSLIDEIGYNIE